MSLASWAFIAIPLVLMLCLFGLVLLYLNGWVFWVSVTAIGVLSVLYIGFMLLIGTNIIA